MKLSENECRKLCNELTEKEDIFFRNVLREDSECDVYSTGSLNVLVKSTYIALRSSHHAIAGEEDAKFIQSFDSYGIIGPEETLSALIPYLPEYKAEKRHVMTITKENFIHRYIPEEARVLKTHKDYRALFSLYREIDEMKGEFPRSDDKINASFFLSKPEPFTAVAFFIEEKAVSGGYIANASSLNAMITAIATSPVFRNRGYASAVTQKLLDVSFTEKGMERLSLCYTNEDVGSIYRNLGFHDIGTWLFLKRSMK